MKDRLLKLAQEIQPHFRQFYLAGGTAIMFRYNHRTSEDLDFLSERTFSVHRLIAKVRKLFPVVTCGVLDTNEDFNAEKMWPSFHSLPSGTLRMGKIKGISKNIESVGKCNNKEEIWLVKNFCGKSI